jgi:hypothetical protein
VRSRPHLPRALRRGGLGKKNLGFGAFFGKIQSSIICHKAPEKSNLQQKSANRIPPKEIGRKKIAKRIAPLLRWALVSLGFRFAVS